MEILYPYSWWKKINLAASVVRVVLRTAITPASLAGGSSRILRVLWRKQWVEDFRYAALAICGSNSRHRTRRIR